MTEVMLAHYTWLTYTSLVYLQLVPIMVSAKYRLHIAVCSLHFVLTGSTLVCLWLAFILWFGGHCITYI